MGTLPPSSAMVWSTFRATSWYALSVSSACVAQKNRAARSVTPMKMMRAPAALSAAQGRPVLWQSLALMDRRFGQGGSRRSATGECPRSVPSSLSSGAPCRQYAQNAHRYVVPIFRKLSWLLRLAVPAMLHSRERGQARSQARTPPRFHNAAIVRMCAQTRSLFASFPFFFPVSFAFVSYLPVLPWQCFSGREAGSCPVCFVMSQAPSD